MNKFIFVKASILVASVLAISNARAETPESWELMHPESASISSGGGTSAPGVVQPEYMDNSRVKSYRQFQQAIGALKLFSPEVRLSASEELLKQLDLVIKEHLSTEPTLTSKGKEVGKAIPTILAFFWAKQQAQDLRAASGAGVTTASILKARA